MWQHLDDHSSLSNSSGVLNSNSLPLSAANSLSSSRIFPDIDAQSGTWSYNIPVTSVTASTSASLNTMFHSSQTLNTPPITSGAASTSNKPLTSRRPLALIQENVHAVGSSSSETQSGVQFSQTSNFQAHVAPATTLSQAGLDHSLRSDVHHPLSGQTQAHINNTRVVHPVQANSQSYVGVGQMGFHQFQMPTMEDALSFLHLVKYRFRNQPQVYDDFMDTMLQVRYQRMDTYGATQRIPDLFRGHPDLIVGFNKFLPACYRFIVLKNEPVQVSIPGSNLGGACSTGPSSLTILPSGATSTSPFLEMTDTEITETEEGARGHLKKTAKPRSKKDSSDEPKGKRGRGRPKTSNIEVKESKKGSRGRPKKAAKPMTKKDSSDEPKAKRGRGRPKSSMVKTKRMKRQKKR